MNMDQENRVKYLKAAFDSAIDYAPHQPFSVNINPIELGKAVGFDDATTKRIATWHVQNGFATSTLGLKSFFITPAGLNFLEQNPFNKESVIRAEAKEFYDWKVKDSSHTQPIDTFHEIKTRLNDFYSADDKAIFLDEIQQKLKKDLVDHRKHTHGGKPKPDCNVEIVTEKLIFYIHQELGTYPTIAHKITISHPKHERNKVFVSYCHVDKEYLKDVQRHFKPFTQNIDFWDDTKILPGNKWKEDIANAINQTKIAILLVSTDYLGSDFVRSNELPPLLKAAKEDGATILTVILKHCLFDEFPELNQYQAMNPPEKPVSTLSENEREELFVNLVRQTKRILER